MMFITYLKNNSTYLVDLCTLAKLSPISNLYFRQYTVSMSVASRYSVQASSILLLVSALLLLLSIFRGTFEPSLATTQSSLKDRHLPTEFVPVLDILASPVKSTALPFGRQDLALNFSATFNSVGPKRLSERAPPREPLAWPTLVCKGGILLEKIRAAFEANAPPGREFSSDDLNNGWTTVAPFPGAIPETSLDKYWASAFPESKDKQLEIKSINVKQDKNYQTNDGTQITVNGATCYTPSLSTY